MKKEVVEFFCADDWREIMGILVISRHGESEWNLLGKWTGWTDVNLTEKGHNDTVRLGALLKGVVFNEAYTSSLKRTQQTFGGATRRLWC